MAKETQGVDPNYGRTLQGMDLSTGKLPTNVYVDESTHRLMVNAVISGGAASDGAIVDGAGSGNKAGVIQSVTTPGIYGVVIVNADGSAVGGGGGGGGTQYVDGVAQPTHPTGNALVYGNGANMTAVSSTTPLPVSGTFWQTTQPVSIATMPSTPVTGTFWQATQPVSGTVTSNISGSISNTSFNATTPLTTQTIGQTTSNTTQVQLTASSIVPSNGVTIQALSTNTASIFVGITGVLTTTGFELQAGQQMQFAPTNANLMYIIGANATDKVCYLIS